ncbi:SGNH/GDSL hydrolase family protein [Polyangium spumosum]|uniref:SGNH/GDSL hydrolase family protein n=1 Tax=Polyangium spumosum TaxID=889282 RepID=A0A6N7Q1A3_9BACT|nr:SGNH/GDSL hydrolase family protein [Polyangium spumosum]
MEPEAAPPIEGRTVVLHIGDSFLMAGFSQALRPRMKAVGAYYEVRSEQASYTTSWHLKLAKLVGDYHPDLVIINLGANEVSLTDPEARADAVERLVKIVADRPCVWVSPPLWRKDTGIIEVFRKHTSPCRFFDSDAVAGPISRQPDGIHPDAAGGAAWAEAFFKWLLAERAPAPKEGEALPKGSGRHAVNPWRLRPTRASTPPQKTAQTQP